MKLLKAISLASAACVTGTLFCGAANADAVNARMVTSNTCTNLVPGRVCELRIPGPGKLLWAESHLVSAAMVSQLSGSVTIEVDGENFTFGAFGASAYASHAPNWPWQWVIAGAYLKSSFVPPESIIFNNEIVLELEMSGSPGHVADYARVRAMIAD